jgi:hypothetical protein
MEDGDRLYSSTFWTSTKCGTNWRLNEKTARLNEKHFVTCSKKDDGPVRKPHIIEQKRDEEFHGLHISEQQCHIKGTVCAYVIYRQCSEHIFSEVMPCNIHMKKFSVLCRIQSQDWRAYTFIKVPRVCVCVRACTCVCVCVRVCGLEDEFYNFSKRKILINILKAN